MMRTRQFWFDLIERAVKTAAQTAAGLLGGELIGIFEVDWQSIASISAMAAIGSLITSLASCGVGDVGTASILRTSKHGE